MKQLRHVMMTAGAHNGRHYVGGIARAFDKYGYCARDHWFVQFTESRKAQGDKAGKFHPNLAGQDAIAAEILGAVGPALEPDDDNGPVFG
jgi:hypothetical protein